MVCLHTKMHTTSDFYLDARRTLGAVVLSVVPLLCKCLQGWAGLSRSRLPILCQS